MNAVPKQESASPHIYKWKLSAILRVAMRLMLVLAWTIGCSVLVRLPWPVAWRRKLAFTWVSGMRRLLGMRVTVRGIPPAAPYFFVINHMSWLDLFAVMPIVRGRAVAEDPLRTAPLVGALARNINPIFVRRVKEDTARVLGLMTEALRNGESLLLAPENPVTTAPVGQLVRQFRAGLIGAAVAAGRPVHYGSLTYRTPAGWPPPSKALIFGPNPWYKPDGVIPDSELAAFGEERSFLGHAMGVLGLPWHEVIITFGPAPVAGTDKIKLANDLHRAVVRIFTPIE